jgi:tetratricopeptide (TPR) repeat protein
MRRQLASAQWLEGADKLAGAFFAVFAAIGVFATVAGGPTWLVVALAAVGVLGAALGILLKALHERARSRGARAALVRRPPIRVREAAATELFYSIGVDAEAAEALAILGGDYKHAPYLDRDVDEALRSALRTAAGRASATLVVVSGRSKTGKSRTLLEGIAAELEDAWLLWPRDGGALAMLADAGPPREIRAELSIIWLDDIEPWAKPGDQGLSPHTLEVLNGWRQPVLVLAAEGGKGIDLAGPEAAWFHEITSDLLARAHRFRLDPEVSDREAGRIGARFAPEVAARIQRDGIGEFMIAAPRLVARLETDRNCAEGRAIVRAAVDCQRAGLLRPLPSEWLQTLYGHYLPGPVSPEGFRRGVGWATQPLYARTALLSRDDEQPDSYAPYDYIVDYTARRGRPVEPAVWDQVVDEYANTEAELLAVATVAYRAEDWARAERAARRADDRGSAAGAVGLGVLLEERGDLDGADAAYRRADDRDSADGAFNLGLLLQERGDEDGAMAAYRRADERGHAAGAYNLGVLLQERGDLDGADAAYRRADERGHADAASNLGLLLQERGDLDGAEAAYRRADDRAVAAGAFNLGLLLQERGDEDGAMAAYRRADERGEAVGTYNLGVLLERRGDEDGAMAAYRRADERGHAAGAYNLGGLLRNRGDEDGAVAAYRRADERGLAAAAYNLGLLLHRHDDLDGAEAAYRRADQRGHAGGASILGLLLEQRGDVDGAEAAYRRADERSDAGGAFNLGLLLEQRGDLNGAEAAYRRADDRAVAAGDIELAEEVRKAHRQLGGNAPG